MIRVILNGFVFFLCLVMSVAAAAVVGAATAFAGVVVLGLVAVLWVRLLWNVFVDSFWFQWANLSDGRNDPKWAKWPFKD